MKKLIAFLVPFTILISLSFGQTWKEKVELMEKKVQQKLEQQRIVVELRFSNQMRRVWLEAQLFDGLERPPVPKPTNPTLFDPATTPWENNDDELILAPMDPAPDKPKTPEPDGRPTPTREPALSPDPGPRAENDWQTTSPLLEERVAALKSEMSPSYFGKQMTFRYDPRMRIEPVRQTTENKIADLWMQMDGSQYELLLYQLQRNAQKMKLNDWGYCQLVNRAARQIFPKNKNSRTLFNWFCLSKSGYISTVCYRSDKLYLMMPSQQIIYGASFLKKGDGTKFYAIDLDGGTIDLHNVKVFSHKHPEATRKLNFEMKTSPVLGYSPLKKKLKFDFNGKDYELPIQANKNLLNFYTTYPFMDLDVYMSTPLSRESYASLLKPLRDATKEMSEEEGVNFILRFVQTAFEYKSDHDQFGKERYLFAEETLAYPYSDCEDRSVLFVFLTRKILKMDVVGLLFPGHAATAVKFRDKSIKGDHITYQGSKYIICDPTYINATLGMCLPEFKNKEAKIITHL